MECNFAACVNASMLFRSENHPKLPTVILLKRTKNVGFVKELCCHLSVLVGTIHSTSRTNRRHVASPLALSTAVGVLECDPQSGSRFHFVPKIVIISTCRARHNLLLPTDSLPFVSERIFWTIVRRCRPRPASWRSTRTTS